MLRSFISLLLLAGISTSPFNATVKVQPVFNPEDLLEVFSVPSKNLSAIEPVIDSKAAILMDLDSGILLYKKDPHKRLPMASLTKIMTAIVILENHDLDEVVTVSEDFNQAQELGVRIWLHQYEKITVRNLLIALLVRSAGDAAMALTYHHSDTTEDFVVEMNRKAESLNLKNTHFENPIGLDKKDHYSSAFDLAILTKYALRNADFRWMIRIPKATVTSTDGQIKHTFDSTNYLLDSYLDIRGVKTGTTDDAGQSLINLARHTNGKEVLTVLLNSPERFQESKRLIDWSFRNFQW